MPQDWYRNTTWTASDAQNFFARFARARSDSSKAQYLWIQALTLQETQHFAEALQLLDMCLEQFPNCFDITLVLRAKAECCFSLGRYTEALAGFRSAVESQRARSGVVCYVALAFAEAFHDYDSGTYGLELLQLLEAETSTFTTISPDMALRYAIVLAQVNAGLGEMKFARKWADRALSLQKRHSATLPQATENQLRSLVAAKA